MTTAGLFHGVQTGLQHMYCKVTMLLGDQIVNIARVLYRGPMPQRRRNRSRSRRPVALFASSFRIARRWGHLPTLSAVTTAPFRSLAYCVWYSSHAACRAGHPEKRVSCDKDCLVPSLSGIEHMPHMIVHRLWQMGGDHRTCPAKSGDYRSWRDVCAHGQVALTSSARALEEHSQVCPRLKLSDGRKTANQP